MYVLSFVVWSSLGIAPIIDKVIEYPKFESCEAQRIRYNELYEAEMIAGNIVGYESSCTKKQ